jgi:SNF2 family DNA or RNA helicase
MKNNLSKRYQNFIKFKWKYVVPLSATIIGNRLSELKNIYNLIGKSAPVRMGEIDLSVLKKDLIRVPKSKLNLPAFIKKDIPIKLNFTDEYTLFRDDILEDIAKNKQIAIKEGKRPVNILTQLLRLNQYCSDRNIVMDKPFPIEEQNKFKVLFEIIDSFEKDEPVIIWSNFVNTNKNLYKFLSEYFTCGVIYGDIKQPERDVLLDKFKKGEIKILVANPSTVSTGVTLINANKMIYFDRDFSSIKYIQSQGRISRIGQTKECTMYNLFYEDTIEEYIIDILKSKEEMINEVLENGTNTDNLMTNEILKKLGGK